MNKDIKFGLDRLVEAGLGPNWSEFWQEKYKNAPLKVKRHFMLEQFASFFLTTKEFWKERDKIESTLTEEEWWYLLNQFASVHKMGFCAYSKRMQKYYPHTKNPLQKRKNNNESI